MSAFIGCSLPGTVRIPALKKRAIVLRIAEFRTPSLRNVGLTAPYLHDGSAADIPAAITAHGASFSAGDAADLIAFLGALTDQGFVTDPRYAMPVKACGKPL